MRALRWRSARQGDPRVAETRAPPACAQRRRAAQRMDRAAHRPQLLASLAHPDPSPYLLFLHRIFLFRVILDRARSTRRPGVWAAIKARPASAPARPFGFFRSLSSAAAPAP